MAVITATSKYLKSIAKNKKPAKDSDFDLADKIQGKTKPKVKMPRGNKLSPPDDQGNGLGKVIKTMNAYLDSYENDFIIAEQDPGRYFYLRPSSFPYCGFEKLLNAHKDLDAPRLNEFASTYFTEVGHTTHAVFQEFGGRAGKIVGDWECKTCKATRKFSCDNICDCGCAMHYHELEVRYKGLVVGHIDGLFRLDPSKGKKSVHIVIDYKTTSKKKIELKGDKSPFPYKYNIAQIESYVPLAEIQYGISIDYFLLIYLARDAPFKWGRAIRGKFLSVEDKAKTLKKIDRYVKTHWLVLRATTRKDFEKVETRKLCKSLDDYTANYKGDHSECSHCTKCFTEPETLITKALKYKIYPILDHAPKKIKRVLQKAEDGIYE